MKKIITFGAAFALFFALAAPLASSAATLTRQLELGMSGSDVTALQVFLASDTSLYPEGLVTGYFGSLTKAAVARYQSRNGLSPVGRVGPQTLQALGDLTDSGRTVGYDQSAPVIGGISVSVSGSSATLAWNTSEAASAVAYYDTAPIRLAEANANTGVSISGASIVVNTALASSHTASIMGLQANTVYNYVVYVRDASGNVNITLPASFRTN